MFRSVRNAAVDAWRKDEKQGESLLELSRLNGSAHESGRYQELELRLESLAADERETIVLKVFDDLTFKEIAPATGCVRAQRMDLDAGTGSILLNGDVENVHKSVLNKADSVFLFQDRLIVVAVSSEGAIEINGDRIKRESFRRAMKEIGAGPRTSVLLRGGRKTEWELIVGLMDDLKALGVTSTSLRTPRVAN